MNREKEQEKQKLCRRYCRELRRALVCVPELRERTLAQLTESVEEYLDEHPTADYQELVRVFGTPAQAAENVLNEMDAKQVQQLTQLLFSSREGLEEQLGIPLDPEENAVEGVGIPFHAGAAAYYKAAGITVDEAAGN